MSIDKHLDERNVSLNDDNSLPVGQRTQRNVKRLIAAVRAAESEFNEELRGANNRCREAQDKVIALQDRLRVVEAELSRCKMEKQLEQMDAVSVADRTKLLEAV